MKRTVPLVITFLTGMVFIIAPFIPYTQGWKEDVALWFDILASIAMVLGGGNLFFMNLKKISDRKQGWGYAAVTLVAFVITLTIGMLKLGCRPGADSERYGYSSARLKLAHFPLYSDVEGTLPTGKLPAAVKGQVSSPTSAMIRFRGWLAPAQVNALKDFDFDAHWHAIVDKLAEKAHPPERLKDRIIYQAQLQRLLFKGVMSDEDRRELKTMGEGAEWTAAVDALYAVSRASHTVNAAETPVGFAVPKELAAIVTYDAGTKTLSAIGPLLPEQRDQLFMQPFAAGKPLGDAEKLALRTELEKEGPLSAALVERLQKFSEERPTVGQRNKALLFQLLETCAKDPASTLNQAQRNMLLTNVRAESPWRTTIGDLFIASQQVKYPWSGEYNSEGSGLWYVFQYLLVPLTSTMFALLAFYVASAAFRAFRAKNIEATLLLLAAFVVLLGQTYAGALLADLLPKSLSWAGTPELKVFIMNTFTTAGNRAIMIGIALGIVSTSLKILLGIDRSYLGPDSE